MTEPTKEQITIFWEWCGIKRLPVGPRNYHFELTKKVMDWEYPNGITQPFLPDLTLDNLFKYAVPKLPNNASIHLERFAREKLYTARIGMYFERFDTDPALALFWAIWEIIK